MWKATFTFISFSSCSPGSSTLSKFSTLLFCHFSKWFLASYFFSYHLRYHYISVFSLSDSYDFFVILILCTSIHQTAVFSWRRSFLLVTRYFLLVTRFLLLVTRYFYSLLVTFYSLLIASYSLLVTFYSLLVTCYLLLFTRYSLLLTFSLLLLTRDSRGFIRKALHYVHNVHMKLYVSSWKSK